MRDDGGAGQGRDALSRWLAEGGCAALDFALGGALDIVGVVDRELTIRYVNWTAKGLTREGVVGVCAVDLSPPEYREIARKTYLEVLETGRGTSFEVIYRDDDQVLIWDVRIGPIRVDGEIIGLVTLNADITEQRRAQADRDRFFSLSLDLLVVATFDGRFKRANPAFAETLGYSQRELLATPFIEFVHPDDRANSMEVFGRLRGGTSVVDFENRYRCRDGTYRVLSWRCNHDPVTGDLYGVARDITQQRAVELQLRQAQKMEAVGQLAGGVAHDFNNLMFAILANTELGLTGSPPPSAALADRLGEIQAAASRAADLTKQLLTFSRRQPLQLVPVDLNALVKGLMTMLRRLIPEHVAVELCVGQALARVHADPGQLEQVLVNLCVNARDAMEGGGTLAIKTDNVVLGAAEAAWARPGSYVLLSVSDTGEGMTEEVRERIFEPFFSTKALHRGTGLGLSMVYGIVRQHDGMLRVDSEVGRGSTFTVYLPAIDRPAAQAPEQEPEPAPRGRETILLAEDEPAVRTAMVEVLERAGYQTIAAADGVEALRLLQQRPETIHLALLDVVMPGMGGPEAWDKMRPLRQGMKVLFCSGYADERYLKHLPANASVLQKPFGMDDLLLRIREALDG